MNAPSQPAQPSKRGGYRPGAGRPVGSKTQSGRRFLRDQLVNAFVAKLGDDVRADPIRMAKVERAASLEAMLPDMRDAVLAGKIRLQELTSLEGLAIRAVKALNLPLPNAAAASPSITEYWASRQEAEE